MPLLRCNAYNIGSRGQVFNVQFYVLHSIINSVQNNPSQNICYGNISGITSSGRTNANYTLCRIRKYVESFIKRAFLYINTSGGILTTLIINDHCIVTTFNRFKILRCFSNNSIQAFAVYPLILCVIGVSYNNRIRIGNAGIGCYYS